MEVTIMNRILLAALTRIISKEELKVTEIQKQNAIDEKAIGTIEMDALEFLKLTTGDDAHLQEILNNAKPLAAYEKSIILPFLEFEVSTGKVTNHEGRHRAAALLNAGNKWITIALYPRGKAGKHREWESLEEMPTRLKGQFRHTTALIDPKNIEPFLQNFAGYDPNTGEKV